MIAALIAAALLVVSQDAPCPPDSGVTGSFDVDSPKPLERSGPGLWIAGTPFAREDLRSVTAGQNEDTGQWELTLAFSPAAAERFAAITRCRLHRLAEVSVDGVVISRPAVHEPILGGEVRISGNFTREEASAMAAGLAPPKP